MTHTRSAFALVLALLGFACGAIDQPAVAQPPAQTGTDRPATAGVSDRSIPAEHLDRIVALTNRGIALMDQFNPVDAAAAFEEVVGLAPAWPTGRVNLGIALLNMPGEEQLTRAEAELRAAIAADPDNPYAQYSLAMLLRHRAQFDEARTHFARVLEIDPTDADAHYQLGALLANTDAAAARRHFEQALASTPHHASASYRLLALLRAAGETDAAHDLLAVFQELTRTESGVTLGMEYGTMGRYADVVRVFGPAAAAPTAAAPPPVYMDAAAGVGLTHAAGGRLGWPGEALADHPTDLVGSFGPGAAVADVDGDGDLDVYIPRTGAEGGAGLYLNADGQFTPAAASGIDDDGVVAGFFGDYNGDGDADLFVTRAGPNRLYANDGTGVFSDATAPTGTAGAAVLSLGAAWADTDHDGDLDLYVANYCPVPLSSPAVVGAPNVLWRNNGDGTFIDVAADAGIDGGAVPSVGVLFFDCDGDRDLDVYVVNDRAPNRLFFNDRIGRYRDAGAAQPALADAGSGLGALVADLNRDGREDLLLLRGVAAPSLFVAGTGGRYLEDAAFGSIATSLGGAIGAALADVDLDGDVDIALFDVGTSTRVGHVLLLNDGAGAFGRPLPLAAPAESPRARGAVAADLDGDGAVEFLVAQAGAAPQLWKTSPPAGRHWLTVNPFVRRGEDHRTTSPGIGLSVEVKAGRSVQSATILASGGYLGGVPARAHFGLGDAAKVDYVRLVWPDAILQSEIEVPANQTWRVAQMRRKPSSCPVLFCWNGERFAFVADFLGVGGLGFFIQPGLYAPPDPDEAVRIPPELARPRDGKYLLRITEPLEEVVYMDALRLEVYDHPSDWELHPDERLAGAPPWPTGEPWAVRSKIFPVAARTERGVDVRDRVLAIDREYVEPPLDLRFVGYAQDHWLELDFGDQLANVPADVPVILYLYSWVEYPYSHVNYAAYQAGHRLEPTSVEIPDGRGGWRRVMPEAGYPGGLPRMMTLDVSALPLREDGRLRLRTNMEVFWDQAFIGAEQVPPDVRQHTLHPTAATLRHLGFPREFSPDGQVPTEYDYDRLDQGVPFKNLTGAYTRIGDVRELLERVDDRFVIMGRAEEIALEFDATALPTLPAGWTRTLVLHSEGYCKDMDMYTAFPDTVEPLPYHAMASYPPADPYPQTPETEAYRREWNTRIIAGQ